MRNKCFKIPAIILSIGVILAVGVFFLTSQQKVPTVTKHDFPFSITYKIDGETKTLEGVYSCRFEGFGNNGIDPLTRYYLGQYTVNGETIDSPQYTIAEKDGYTLNIIMTLDDSYLMGDTKNDSYDELTEPVLEAMDADGNQYIETELPTAFDAEIVSFEYPEPVKNSFVFASFSGLYVVNMSAMVLIGLVTLLLCIIFVKKADGVVYSPLDIIGVVLNFASAIVALPIIYIASYLIQAFPTGPDWINQAFLCIPPMIPFTLAASVSLRRKGHRLCGFLIQFIWAALFVILIVLE